MCPYSGRDHGHGKEEARGRYARAGSGIRSRCKCARGKGGIHGSSHGSGARRQGSSQVPVGRVFEFESGGGLLRPMDCVSDCHSESKSGEFIWRERKRMNVRLIYQFFVFSGTYVNAT